MTYFLWGILFSWSSKQRSNSLWMFKIALLKNLKIPMNVAEVLEWKLPFTLRSKRLKINSNTSVNIYWLKWQRFFNSIRIIMEQTPTKKRQKMVPVGCRVHEESSLDVFFVCSASALRRDKLALFLYNMHTYLYSYIDIILHVCRIMLRYDSFCRDN